MPPCTSRTACAGSTPCGRRRPRCASRSWSTRASASYETLPPAMTGPSSWSLTRQAHSRGLSYPEGVSFPAVSPFFRLGNTRPAPLSPLILSSTPLPLVPTIPPSLSLSPPWNHSSSLRMFSLNTHSSFLLSCPSFEVMSYEDSIALVCKVNVSEVTVTACVLIIFILLS